LRSVYPLGVAGRICSDISNLTLRGPFSNYAAGRDVRSGGKKVFGLNEPILQERPGPQGRERADFCGLTLFRRLGGDLSRKASRGGSPRHLFSARCL